MPNLTSQMEAVCRRFEELSIRLNQPETAADPAQFRRLMQEYHEAQPVVDAYHALTTAQDHLAQAKALLEGDEPLDADFKAMVQQELSEKSQDVAELENNLKILLLPKDVNDEKSVIMEIRAGAGGEEAALFAHSLVRMYTMYVQSRGWEMELLNLNETELGGTKEAVFAVNGRGAYNRLKYESGVHRVQRVPVTESNGRIQTSAATVAVMPEAIERLAKWTGSHDVIQGSRYDYDGGPFYWQYDFIVPLGIPNPIAPAAFGPAGYRVMDTLCFEGGLFRRNIVEQIGLPDPRFFIYWDDTMYGYRASKVTNPIVVPDVILRRTREIGNWDIAGVRQLNSTSDMNRYHIMRNRGYMARYFMTYGDYRPLLFGLGTVLTAVKEVIRLTMVDREHFKTGIVQIAKGWWDSRKLLHDPEWQPMPPLK